MSHVKGVNDWKKLGRLLGVTKSETEVIEQHPNSNSDEECLCSMFQLWVLRDPGVSWRKLIYSLDRSRHIKVADPIRSWAEPVKGMLSTG